MDGSARLAIGDTFAGRVVKVYHHHDDDDDDDDDHDDDNDGNDDNAGDNGDDQGCSNIVMAIMSCHDDGSGCESKPHCVPIIAGDGGGNNGVDVFLP